MEVGEKVDHIFIIPNQKACSHKRIFSVIEDLIYLRSSNCKNNSPWVIHLANLLFKKDQDIWTILANPGCELLGGTSHLQEPQSRH